MRADKLSERAFQITASVLRSAFTASQCHSVWQGMRERAALLGGKLTVRSARNQGTTVILELPLNSA